jgi:hypothetical protein
MRLQQLLRQAHQLMQDAGRVADQLVQVRAGDHRHHFLLHFLLTLP